VVLIYEPIDEGREYIFKDINRATEKILRMRKKDLIGRKLFEVFPDLPNPDVRDALIRVLRTEKPEFLPPLQYRKGKDFSLDLALYIQTPLRRDRIFHDRRIRCRPGGR